MPAWNEGRRAGQSARAGAQLDRLASGIGNVALPEAAKRWDKQVCVYCGGRLGRRTGVLPITGKVWYCREHAERYKKDKVWEDSHKKGL